MKRSEVNELVRWADEFLARNNIHTDNFFLEPVSRFADIEEDEPPVHLLCNEYAKLDV